MTAGGAIDPNGFHDPITSTRYLLYKVDGNGLNIVNSCDKFGAPTPIMLQKVANDGVSLIANPVELLVNDKDDGPNIEAPALLYRTSNYYLIYNSHCYATQQYTVRYAVSTTGITGPYWKISEPLLTTGQVIDGVTLHAPGGVDVLPSNSSRIVFHADTNVEWFDAKKIGAVGRNRAMFTAELVFDGQGLMTAQGIDG